MIEISFSPAQMSGVAERLQAMSVDAADSLSPTAPEATKNNTTAMSSVTSVYSTAAQSANSTVAEAAGALVRTAEDYARIEADAVEMINQVLKEMQ